MKNVKKEIEKDEAIAKSKMYDKKMSELEQKASEKEAQKKKEEILQAEREKQLEAKKKAAADDQSDFLGNLVTYKVE